MAEKGQQHQAFPTEQNGTGAGTKGRKRDGFTMEFTPGGRRALNALKHFTGFTRKRIIERALKFANKNRAAFVADAIGGKK